jgi:hypothetical protein
MFRQLGIEPPKWHGLGPMLIKEKSLFLSGIRRNIVRLSGISRWLRKE